jgi:hypothetical protein
MKGGIAAIGLALVVSGCVSSAAPHISPQEAKAKQLNGQYTYCTFKAYTDYRKTASDKNMAAEQAFQACATEEQALITFAADAGLPSSVVPNLRASLKHDFISAPDSVWAK